MASCLKPQSFRKWLPGLWLACLAGLPLLHQPANAQAFLEQVKLVSIQKGGLSSLARDLSRGMGGLSNGSRYSFDRYYSTDIPEIRFTMLSPINSNFGILWGFGTGESGDKYRIEPSLKLGFLLVDQLSRNEWLSLSITAVLWGYLREKPCSADYGAVGGVQTVNCRMADSVLSPSETLKYLENKAPADQLSVSLRYQLRF